MKGRCSIKIRFRTFNVPNKLRFYHIKSDSSILLVIRDTKDINHSVWKFVIFGVLTGIRSSSCWPQCEQNNKIIVKIDKLDIAMWWYRCAVAECGTCVYITDRTTQKFLLMPQKISPLPVFLVLVIIFYATTSFLWNNNGIGDQVNIVLTFFSL